MPDDRNCARHADEGIFSHAQKKNLLQRLLPTMNHHQNASKLWEMVFSGCKHTMGHLLL
jgi:hypothetical protein